MSRSAEVMMRLCRGFRAAGRGRVVDVDSVEVRKAENEAIFRDANEEIEAARAELTKLDGKVPFFCECDDAMCRETVRLDTREYEFVRASPTRFLIAIGHPHDEAQLVVEHDAYVVVEKEGVAARVARETDPRAQDG